MTSPTVCSDHTTGTWPVGELERQRPEPPPVEPADIFNLFKSACKRQRWAAPTSTSCDPTKSRTAGPTDSTTHLPPRAVRVLSRSETCTNLNNIDWNATITLEQVDYFDTHGKRVRRYLSAPMALKPLATAEFMVSALDDEGGSGANFLVEWSGPTNARSPLAETIMVGQTSGGYLSFTSRGVELKNVEAPAAAQ